MPFVSGASAASVRRGSRDAPADVCHSGRQRHAGPSCHPTRNSRPIPAHGAPGCASSAMPIAVKGRHLVVGWVAVFLAVAVVITLRDRAAFDTTTRIGALRDTLQVLD